jgi:hypothetical protein
VALTERLQIIVTADGKGAAQEFQKIGATAERELGRTDDRIKRLSSGLISNGTQIALAGGIATAGVFALAKAAGDYEEAASAAGVIFGDSAESIEEFGKKAIDAAGLSRRAAVEAANTFGTFGKAAGLTGDDLASFSTDLTQLAGDLASFKNTSTEDAITAIGAALRGESEPIRRYGVLLDDATLKQEALALGIYDGTGALDQQTKVLAAQSAIFKQTSDAQGDFARTSDSLSNQTRAFTAEIDNLKVGLGEGAVPVFSELVAAANGALSSFQELSPETQNFVGKIGAIGAVGVTAVGALSVLAGGALRAVDTFRDLSGRLITTETGMRRLGTTAKVAGGVLATFAISDALFTFLNDGAGRSREVADAINEIKIAAQQLDTVGVGEGFINAVAAEQNTLRLQNLWQEFGDEVDIVGSGVKADVEQVQRAFDGLAAADPTGARLALDDLEARTAGLDKSSRQYEINSEFIERNRESLRLAAEAGGNAADATGKLTDKSTIFGQVLAVVEDAQIAATEATDGFATSLDMANKMVKLSGDLFNLASNRADGFLNSLENSTGMDDMLESVFALNEGLWTLRDSVGNLSASVDISDIADGIARPMEDTIGVLQDWIAVGDEAQQVIADVFEFRGAEEATRRADQIRLQFVGIMDQAGYTDEQIVELLQTMGLLPEQVNTAITISGQDEAIAKLTLLRDFYLNEDGSSGIPAEVNTQVSVAIAEGRFVDAANLISTWVQDQEDGSIENPLLIALGLGDTKPASDEVDGWKAGEEAKPPAEVPVGADTGPASKDVDGWRRIQEGRPPVKVKVGIEAFPIFGTQGSSGGTGNISAVGGRDGNIYTPFATGGMAEAGVPLWANEPSLGGELFVPKTDGFVMKASDTDRLIGGLEQLLSGQGGGSGVTVNQQIVTADPVVAGSEAARKMRDAQFLAGV